MRVNKHGLPGIGVTGKKGKNGKTGNSFYIGPIDLFFEYIGGDILKNSSIDYDDIDYDITYANDELRLSHIYNEGDILYVTDPSTYDVLYMIEITEDMTTCTKDYFLKHIKQNEPFTKKLGSSENDICFPVNIINSSGDNTYLKNMCNKHMEGLIKGIYLATNSSSPNKQTISELPEVSNKFEYVPSRYLNTPSITRLDVINNGDTINKYTFRRDTTAKDLLYFSVNTSVMRVGAYGGSHIKITAKNLYIDNLYVKDGNFGNVESYNTLYAPELNLDNDGNCYTLNTDDYYEDLETFIVDISSFFRDPLHTYDGYHFGTIHKYWNYNEETINIENTSYFNSSYYKPNYTRSTVTENTQTNITKIKLTPEGDYVRNWDSSQYMNIDDMYVRQTLIYVLDTSTLKDASYLLNKSVSNETYNKYSNCSGIIVTEQVPVFRTYDAIKMLNGYEYRNYREIATSGHGNGLYNSSNEFILDGSIDKFIDTSFYSNIEYTIDSSVTKINLALLDPTASLYRHHEITLWISTPNGLKYFSKQTRADYNVQTNTFDISADWISRKPIVKPGLIDGATTGNADLFTLIFSGSNLTINASTNGDDDIVTKIELYENSVLKGTKMDVPSTGICEFTVSEFTGESVTTNASLISLYKNQDLDIKPNHVLYTIKYALENEETCTHIATYDREIGGYTEYRKFPKISLHSYNDMESLEQLNNVDNGILVNQFLTFVDLKIDDFNKETWGKMQNKYPDPILNIVINKSFSLKKPKYDPKSNPNPKDKPYGIKISDSDYKISYSLIKPDVDVFKASAKELVDTKNIKEPDTKNIKEQTESYSFTLDEASAGIYKLRILIETTNPIPVYGIGNVSIELKNVSVTYANGKSDNSLSSVTDVITAEPIKFVIAPLSYVAGYMQKDNNEAITNLGTYKWYGSEKIVNIVLKPYGLDFVQGSSYSTNRDVNWNALKFKRRYLQDNIQTMSVSTLNINALKDLLPETLYNDDTLAGDKDDIYKSYLQFVYDSECFNPCNMHDEYQFQYNNNSYLASEYGLLANNTAVFITQENQINLRSLSLLNSMKVWNNEYKSYKYESDNPYKGHIETYGNGYQYLPNTVDKEQYLSDSIMTLADVKRINSEEFMSSNTYFEFDCNQPEKMDDYVPSKLYRTLLYNLKWVYPKYYSEDDINLINQLPFTEASINGTTPGDTTMPYNLCYTISPRVMFNDEELTNIILMLRKPTVINEPKDSLSTDDLCLPNITSIEELSNPINVMN